MSPLPPDSARFCCLAAYHHGLACTLENCLHLYKNIIVISTDVKMIFLSITGRTNSLLDWKTLLCNI